MKLEVSMVVVWLSVMSTAIAGDTTAATAVTPSAVKTLLQEVQGVKQMLASERQGMTQVMTAQHNGIKQMMTAQHNGIKQMLTSKQQAAPSSYSTGASGSSVELLAIKNKLMALETKLEAAKAKQEATEAKLQATQTNQKAMQTKLEAELQAEKANQKARQTKLEAELQAAKAKQKATQTRLEAKLEAAKAKQDATEATLKTLKSNRKSGSTFIRWGRKTCSNTSRLVYSGVAGGSWFHHSGAAANPLCLTMKPQFDDTRVPVDYALLFGAEYKHIRNHEDHDVPCSVCRAPHPTTIMIPATRVCPKGWTTQYTGHLSANRYTHNGASQYVCLDKDLENANNGNQKRNGYLFYYTVTRCGSLPCPPYANNRVVLCVVCSK